MEKIYNMKYCVGTKTTEGCGNVDVGRGWQTAYEWMKVLAKSIDGKVIPQMDVEETICDECLHK